MSTIVGIGQGALKLVFQLFKYCKYLWERYENSYYPCRYRLYVGQTGLFDISMTIKLGEKLR